MTKSIDRIIFGVCSRLGAALITSFLLSFTSLAQSTLTLDKAIRQAQDSTKKAFESRYNNEYQQLHYDEFMALRKPQLNLRIAPNYYKVISDLSRDYVYLRNYDNLSAAASVTLSQKMLNWGGEAYVGTQAIWTEHFTGQSQPRQFMAAPILVGYRQTLLGYNPYQWEKTVEDLQLKAARQQYQYDMNCIAEEAARRFFRLACAQAELEMCRRSVQVADTLYAIASEKATIAMVPIAELRSLELDRVNAYNQLTIASTTEEVARIRLASYLMVEGDSLPKDYFTIHPSLLTLNPQPITISAFDAINMAINNSPVYQKQIIGLTESRHREQKAKKEKGLNVALDINLGLQQVDQNLGEVFRDQRLYASGGVTLSIPLMDYGAAKNRHAAAQAQVKREESVLEEVERALREDVLSTLHDVGTYYQLLQSTSDAVDTADKVYEMIAENYANGLCDINTYALAEKRRSDALHHYLVTLENYWTTYYHLKTLIGN